MNTTRSDVLVLGGGVIGLSCALALAEAGASVRVLERDRTGCGSSHGNCGTLTPSHAAPLAEPALIGKAMRWMLRPDAPFYVNPRLDLDRLRWLLRFARRCHGGDLERVARARAAILIRSRDQIEAWQRRFAIDCDFATDGGLYVYRDAAEFAASERHVEQLERLGIHAERLDGDAVLALEPSLRPGVVGGVLHPGDARLRPDRYVAGLADRARAAGVVIEEGVAADEVIVERRRVDRIVTASGDYRADHVVLALGAWSPLLVRRLGLRLPMQPGKGYSMTWSRPALAPRRPLTLVEATVCVTTWPSGYRLGSTMEFSGYAAGLNRARLDALRRAAAVYLREPEGPVLEEEWWGWRPMCVDELPLIGPSVRYSNLELATGHGMMGMSMSAATAELVAADLAGAAAPIDPAPYRPGRFGI